MKRILTKKEKQFRSDLHYTGENGEFYQKYPSMWIAVVNKRVVAFGENPGKVEEEASLKTGRSPKEIPIKFIENPGAIF